jgi:hypothetical protein
MAIPSYAYLKLKISRSANIIIVEAKVQWALDYEQNNIKLAIAAVAAIELKELHLQSCQDTKAIQVNAENLSKTIQIGSSSSLK